MSIFMSRLIKSFLETNPWNSVDEHVSRILDK